MRTTTAEVFLQFGQHFHAAPPALAAQAVGRSRQCTGVRSAQSAGSAGAGQETGLGDIGNATVDDDTGIQQDGAVRRCDQPAARAFLPAGKSIRPGYWRCLSGAR